MTCGTILFIFALIAAGTVIFLLGFLIFSFAIDTLEETDTGRWILDMIIKRKR